MPLYTATTADSVPVADAVTRLRTQYRTASDAATVSESNIILGPTINLAVPVAAMPAAAGLLPTEAVDSSLTLVLPTPVGTLVSGGVPDLVLGTSATVFDLDAPNVQAAALLPGLLVGTPAVVGDMYAAPIVLSGLSGSGHYDLQDATVETGEVAAFVPALFAALGARSIWLEYTAPNNGILTFTVNDAATTDFLVAALDGAGYSDPAITVVTQDTADGAHSPSISFAAAKGHTYYVYVASIADTGTKPTSTAYSWSLDTATSSVTGVMTVSPSTYDRAPTAVGVTVLNMAAGETVNFTVGATSAGSLTADSSGVVTGSVTVDGSLAAGTYYLVATGASSGITASGTFQLLNAPLSRPTAPGSDTPVTPPVQTGVQKWVFQDPMPGGLGTLIFPNNPQKASSPYGKLQVTAEHVVAQDGTPVVWEGAQQAVTMQFSGYTDSQTFYNAVLAFKQSNRKFYWIDHRSRVWTVALVSWGEDRRVVRPQDNTDTSWAMNYTGHLMIFAGPM